MIVYAPIPTSVTRPHPLAAKDILALADRFKMIRPDTGPVATKMVERQPFGNRTYKNLVNHSMRVLSTAFKVDVPIPCLAAIGVPLPAAIAELDLLEHTFHGRSIHSCVSYRTADCLPVGIVVWL